jgi:hypothetical protein
MQDKDFSAVDILCGLYVWCDDVLVYGAGFYREINDGSLPLSNA